MLRAPERRDDLLPRRPRSPRPRCRCGASSPRPPWCPPARRRPAACPARPARHCAWPLVGIRARALASAQPASRRKGRNGARVAAAPRRAGRVSSGATARERAGAAGRPAIQTRPTASDQPDEPAGGRAGPPGHGPARCGAGEHQQREMGHVKVAGEGAARGLGRDVAAERAWQIGVGFGREGEPRGPQRERRRHQRREEELQEGDHASASDVALLPAPHGRAGAALALGMGLGRARGACRAPPVGSAPPAADTPRAFASRAATQGQT